MNQKKLGSIDERLLHLIRHLAQEEACEPQTIIAVLEKPWKWQAEADALWEQELIRRVEACASGIEICRRNLGDISEGWMEEHVQNALSVFEGSLETAKKKLAQFKGEDHANA